MSYESLLNKFCKNFSECEFELEKISAAMAVDLRFQVKVKDYDFELLSTYTHSFYTLEKQMYTMTKIADALFMLLYKNSITIEEVRNNSLKAYFAVKDYLDLSK